jgi:hypothetical protein
VKALAWVHCANIEDVEAFHRECAILPLQHVDVERLRLSFDMNSPDGMRSIIS